MVQHGQGEKLKPDGIDDEEIINLYKYKFADIRKRMGQFDTIAFDNKEEIRDAIYYFRQVRNTLIEMKQVSDKGTKKAQQRVDKCSAIFVSLSSVMMLLGWIM